MPHDVGDQIVDLVRRWSEASEIGAGRFVGWLGVAASKFYDWLHRCGLVNEHNRWVPRDFTNGLRSPYLTEKKRWAAGLRLGQTGHEGPVIPSYSEKACDRLACQ